MKVLVVGSGGREHALCWKIAQSKLVKKIYSAPGNGGIAEVAECLDIKIDDIEGLLNFAKINDIGLTVVGPEIPLVMGIVDLFNKNNLKIFGPEKALALLEGSKIFAKNIMKRYGVPTADFKIFDNITEAESYIEKIKKFPVVIKADGPCAGKGVIIANTFEEAQSTLSDLMANKIFGKSGEKIIIEECLCGEEASILVFLDGKDFLMLDSSQDHKRIFDNDLGPNTGGMGAYSPAALVDKKLLKTVIDTIIRPIAEGLRDDKKIYKGILYVGIMATDSGPKVLEFNVRFGDPETQAILPRLKTDIVELMLKSIEGNLKGAKLEWDERSCLMIVLASGGYPGEYDKGKIIEGIDEAKKLKDAFIFHAGTKRKESGKKSNDIYITNGGRVLNVGALGKTIDEAIKNSYEAAKLINFENMYYRTDIGRKALARIKV